MDRVILHSDLNAFYASVECLYHPEIRDKPVAVCGDVEQRHGIILTKNQIAKKYGVSTGEAIWQAKQKCPNLVTVPAHYDLYIQFSHLRQWIDIYYNCRRLHSSLGYKSPLSHEISRIHPFDVSA